MTERGHPQKNHSNPKALCGLLHCGECGCMITAEVQKGHTYYRCTKKKGVCSQGYIREEALIPQLDELFRKYAMPTVWQEEFEKFIAEDEQSSSLQTTAFVQGLRDTVHDISRKLDRLTDLYIAQDIEREDYLARRRILVLEKKSVEEQCSSPKRTPGTGSNRCESGSKRLQHWLK